jgi:hypothetical protein
LIKLIRDKQPITVSALADVLIASIYEQGTAFEQKLAVYKLSTDNRHLLRFLKKRRFFRRKRKKRRRVIRIERIIKSKKNRIKGVGQAGSRKSK